MDAEQDRREEKNAGTIDSIALEAVGSNAFSPNHPNPGLPAELLDPDEPHVPSEPAPADDMRLDEYCDSHRLDARSRVELFIHVCNAVHIAHQHAVIHQNLKPGSILVSSDRVPRLIDFGRANAHQATFYNDAEGEARASLTRTGQPVLACEYTSPEQVTGETVTTSSDIYALGVMLYELITGRRPYYLTTGSVSEVVQAICEQVPAKPSESVIRTPDSLERVKRISGGDLDAIILMAMRKEPQRRHASVDQLANDLKCYLKGLPVHANQDSKVDQVIKFMRRHPAAVVAGALLGLTLVASAIRIATELKVAHRKRTLAEESFSHARETLDQLFTRANKDRLLTQPELDPLRKTLLRDLKHFYENFLNRRGNDPSLQLESATARTYLAQISREIGSTAEAVSNFEQAVALWDSLVTAQPANPVYRQGLAHALYEQGRAIMRLKGRRDDAFRIFRRASAQIEPLVSESRSTTAEYELGLILERIAAIEHERGHAKEAIKNIMRSLAIESKIATLGSDSIDILISMAEGYALLGQILITQPDGTEPAIAAYEQAIALLEKVDHEHPELSDQTHRLALLLGDLSNLKQMTGRLDSALGSGNKAIEILERLEKQHPGILEYEQSLAAAYNLTSDVRRYRREAADAITLAQKAKTLLERLSTQHRDNASLQIDLAKSHNILGRVLQQTGEPVEALRSFQRAVDLYESVPKLDARDCYNLACNVALSVSLIGVKNGSIDVVDISKLNKGDQLRRKRYGDRAIELLRRAVDGGFPDLDTIRSDTDLDPIRDRPDFQSFVEEVEKKTPANTHESANVNEKPSSS